MKMIFIAMISIIASIGAPNETVPEAAVTVAKNFVTFVDNNDAKRLETILHPKMMQFAKIGDKVMPFPGTDFVKMVADKKLGGTPRKITIQKADIIRGETADIVLQAVSHEYDFMYQISLAKESGKWLVLTVISDIKPIK